MIRRAFLRLLGLAPAAAVSCSQAASAQPEEGHWLPVGVVPEWPGDTYAWAYYGVDRPVGCTLMEGWMQPDFSTYAKVFGPRFWSIPASPPAPPLPPGVKRI